MLGYKILIAKEDFEIKERFGNKKYQYKKGKIYLGRLIDSSNIRIYDEKQDGMDFIDTLWCMGPRYPYYLNYFDFVKQDHVSNKKVFNKMLNMVRKEELDGTDRQIKNV